MELYFRVQLQLRHMHDPRYKLYRNGVLLELRETGCRAVVAYIDPNDAWSKQQQHSHYEPDFGVRVATDATGVSWETDASTDFTACNLASSMSSIVAVAYGPNSTVVRSLLEYIRACIDRIQEEQLRGLAIVELRLCPRCCPVPGLYEPLHAVDESHSTFASDRARIYPVQRSLLFADEPPPTKRLICRMKHVTSVDEWECGIECATSNNHINCHGQSTRGADDGALGIRRNWWDPVDLEQLLALCHWYELDGNGEEKRVHLSSTPSWNTCLQRGYVGYATLHAMSSNAASAAEYARVKKWFDSFVTRDDDAEFILDKVEFIYNAALEERFTTKFRQVLERNMQTDDELRDSFSASISSSSSAAQHATNTWNATDTYQMHQHRQWVIQQLDKYVVRVSGNENVNLLMAWHGTSRAVCQKIARSNFYLPRPLADNTIIRRDEGFYGMLADSTVSMDRSMSDSLIQLLLRSWHLLVWLSQLY
jgi:hypothetical protein